MTHPPLIVFTDLDGTLLDHDTYDFSPALPALERLKSLGIPVILASSKTAAEIAPLREELGLSAFPSIVENGAGLLQANQVDLSEEGDYEIIREALSEIPLLLRSHFRGFGDMQPAAIAELTGLPPKQAVLAAKRQFSEPGLWLGDPGSRRSFLATLAKQGIVGREGGRFLTLSHGKTKADQMSAIAKQFGAPPSVALGDAPNDIEMLERASHGVVVTNPHRKPLPPLTGEFKGLIRRTSQPGPNGWNSAMNDILDELGLTSEGDTLG